MKLFLYVLGGMAVIGLAFFVITRTQIPIDNPFLMIAVVGLFAFAPLGGFWMAYMAIRYEKNPLPLVLLALFVPFTFLWYYFERVRPRKLTRPDGPVVQD